MFYKSFIASTLMIWTLMLLTGCCSPSMKNYDAAISFLEEWKKVREPPSRFTALNSYIINEFPYFGPCALPILIADVLVSGMQEKNWTALETQFIEIAKIEELLGTWDCEAYRLIMMEGTSVDSETILNAVKKLYEKFRYLLGLGSVSLEEERCIRELIKALEEEKTILADEICVGDYLVSGIVFSGSHMRGKNLKEEAAKRGKTLHPLILFDGKALPFLFERIREKEHPIKEMCITNAILRRWGIIETASFSSTGWMGIGDIPLRFIEHEKAWFCELYESFMRMKREIQSGRFKNSTR